MLEAEQLLFPAQDELAQTQRDQLLAVGQSLQGPRRRLELERPPAWAQPAGMIRDDEPRTESARPRKPSDRPRAATHRREPGSMKRKQYLKQLRELQSELCHLQDWVEATGPKIIVVFEGRDAAGKGGTIKAITERVSPRVFRVVALPAPSDREKSQIYIQRYMPHFPAGGRGRHLRPQLVQPRRRRARDGLLHGEGARAVPRALPADREVPSSRPASS